MGAAAAAAITAAGGFRGGTGGCGTGGGSGGAGISPGDSSCSEVVNGEGGGMLSPATTASSMSCWLAGECEADGSSNSLS